MNPSCPHRFRWDSYRNTGKLKKERARCKGTHVLHCGREILTQSDVCRGQKDVFGGRINCAGNAYTRSGRPLPGPRGGRCPPRRGGFCCTGLFWGQPPAPQGSRAHSHTRRANSPGLRATPHSCELFENEIRGGPVIVGALQVKFHDFGSKTRPPEEAPLESLVSPGHVTRHHPPRLPGASPPG